MEGGGGKGIPKHGENEGKRNWKAAFWNVAGLANKNKEFWKGLKNWNVIVLSETWVEKKVEKKLRKSYWEGLCKDGKRPPKSIQKEGRRGNINRNKKGIDKTRYGDSGPRGGNSNGICETG